WVHFIAGISVWRTTALWRCWIFRGGHPYGARLYYAGHQLVALASRSRHHGSAHQRPPGRTHGPPPASLPYALSGFYWMAQAARRARRFVSSHFWISHFYQRLCDPAFHGDMVLRLMDEQRRSGPAASGR